MRLTDLEGAFEAPEGYGGLPFGQSVDSFRAKALKALAATGSKRPSSVRSAAPTLNFRKGGWLRSR